MGRFSWGPNEFVARVGILYGTAYENVSAAQSAILDTNYAQETANLTRYQILTQQAAMSLAIANSTPQYLLNLLRPAGGGP